jgi:hypothetical protein
VPADDCHAVIAACERASRPCSPEDAAALTRRLLSVYPQNDRSIADSDAYVAAIAATLARFPIAAASRTASLTKGLPTELKFRPTVADVVEACEAEVKRIRELDGAARWMIEERERRIIARRDEEMRAASKKASPQQIDSILARYRTSTKPAPHQTETK